MADDKPPISSGRSSSSSSKSRKDKTNKVPQRGLGVAQLEKIIKEEQKSRDAVESLTITPCYSSSPNLIPLPPPPPPPNYLPTRPELLRQASLVPNGEIMHQSFVSNQISSAPYVTWPAISGGENNGVENKRLDSHKEFSLQPLPNVLPYDINGSAFPLPIVPHRPRHHLQQLSSSSMVNPSWGVSPLSQRTQMELPSNQNFRSSSYKPSSPAEDKMAGMKRPYPFSLESSSSASLDHKFHSTISKSDELVSSSNRYTVHSEKRDKNAREGASNSSPLPARNSDVIMNKRELTGEFLTLAPPGAAAPLVNTDHKKSYSGQEKPEISDVEPTYLKANTKKKTQKRGGSSEPSPFNFFPIEASTTDEDEDRIDLNLKL